MGGRKKLPLRLGGNPMERGEIGSAVPTKQMACGIGPVNAGACRQSHPANLQHGACDIESIPAGMCCIECCGQGLACVGTGNTAACASLKKSSAITHSGLNENFTLGLPPHRYAARACR